MAGRAEVQQVRVQALHLQQNGADHLRAFRHHDPHAVFHRGGVGGAVGKAADAAHAVRKKRDFVVAHAGLRQLLHAAVDVEQAVVGVDNVLAVDEQAEVARFVRGNVQRANRHHVILLAAQLVDELVGFAVGGRGRALAVVHAVLAQRIEFIRPVVRQHRRRSSGRPTGTSRTCRALRARPRRRRARAA